MSGGMRNLVRGMAVATAVVIALTGSGVLASAAVTPTDRAATNAYLQAEYALYVAEVRNAGAVQAIFQTTAQAIGRECRGVLAGAPQQEDGGLLSRLGLSPRARGEQAREEEQRTTIEEQLTAATSEASHGPDRAAREAFAAAVAPLRWSDPRIAALVAEHSADSLTGLPSTPSGACGDMRAWAQSGYRTLSPGSKAFAAKLQARLEAAPTTGSLSSLLEPYEGPAEQAIKRRTARLQEQLIGTAGETLKTYFQLRRELGLHERHFEAREHEPVFGRGGTAAGLTYVVRREAPEPTARPGCRVQVSVSFTASSKHKVSGFVLSEAFGSSLCVSGHNTERQPSTSCSGKVETITAAVSANVRSVRMRLSDGRAITSDVVLVRSGRAIVGGVYAQAVRGPSPHPVALTELDRNGGAVRELQLPSGAPCGSEPPPQEPVFIPLVTSTTPDGESFTIEGISIHFGHRQSGLQLTLSASLHSYGNEASTIEVGGPGPKAFSWEAGQKCPPHAHAIVYGILHAPGDSVLVRTPSGLVQLTKVPIAAHLHSGGPLAYGVFAALPSELIVRRSDGTVLYAESLAKQGREQTEFCEGYGEEG